MYYLGVDPGIRNTGLVLLKDKQIVSAYTVQPTGDWPQVIATVLDALPNTVHVAAVEEVMWYGRPRKNMLGLAALAGAIVGALLEKKKVVYLLQASFRNNTNIGVKKLRYPKALDNDHLKDAYQLALIARRAETDPAVSDAIKARRITPP